MNKSTFGIMVLVALTMITPAIVIAQSENEENEGNEVGERGENRGVIGNNTSNIILYVTLAAIVGVVNYSAFKVYQARKKATKKLV
jgi:hypothetical protein